MDHPLIEEANSNLRKRVIQLLQMGYSVARGGNIVFVCGGNEVHHMRTRFRQYCAAHLSEFEIFFPEFAMKDYFSSSIPEPFDIADFEYIVGELSHAIVIFPEAPGSFAETGYFSAIDKLSEKTILALDAPRQEFDSFISMGPAKKIAAKSIFQPNVQMDYQEPTFELVASRIRRLSVAKNRKLLKVERFNDLTAFELFALIHRIVTILSIATIDDIIYIMRGIFKSIVSVSKIRHMASILVGCEYIKSIGKYGHYYARKDKSTLLEVRSGFVNQETDIRILLAGIYEVGDSEFIEIIEASMNAD
ncbi:MAG: retron St85 family effector protein [Phenylobacterium sp.]|uniref:retron St85 family effector protein n=1 Tax=Phenylobacterium sp. TaxID=1871053 RepID=UPI0025CBBAE4|nr:retron St85 family effector protein [Phenylobacterium sp.]MCG9915756.1 retron St85 family effector protein [Phenylobacterium sp.]